jgi:hypothetical protein
MSRENDITKHDHRRSGHIHTLLGVVTAVIGLFWLAHKLGWIPVAAGGSQLFWPILTIAVGLWIIYGRPVAKTSHRGRAE